MTEQWKDVVGYEGLYQVSSRGRIMRIAGGRGATPGHILKPWHHRDGYLYVSLCRDGKRKIMKAHRLVAVAFLGPAPSPKHEVNHKNGIKDDDRSDNLEWMTSSENHLHASKHGLNAHGETHGASKLTASQVRQIRKLYATGDHSQRELARMFGVSRPNISLIVNRRTWQHVP